MTDSSSLKERRDLEIQWVVFSAPGARVAEARASASSFLRGAARHRVTIGDFQESYFPSQWPGIKNLFEQVKSEFNPDVVFTHYREDRHQDHRVLSDLAWNTFRNHLILEYEILKYDGDLGAPNAFVPLPKVIADRKVELLLRHFRSQRSKHWFTADTFQAMLRIRGIECASPSGRAEAFYGRKVLVG